KLLHIKCLQVILKHIEKILKGAIIKTWGENMGLKEHKYMDFLTTIGFILSFILAVISVFMGKWQVVIVIDLFIIILLRLVGYIIDRQVEKK
ncbi:hypothetical protein, partial [Sharpea azabuensis]